MIVKPIVDGKATGTVLKSAHPINFLGTVDSTAGKITDPSHDLYGQSIRGTVLAFPHGIGSSVGAYTIYALKTNDVAPSAMVCTRADASVVSGCAIAGIPLLLVDEGFFESIQDRQSVSVDATVGTITPL